MWVKDGTNLKTHDVYDIVLVFALLTLNIFHTIF